MGNICEEHFSVEGKAYRNNPEGYFILGNDYIDQGEHEKAIEAYSRAIDIVPNHPQYEGFSYSCFYNRGCALIQTGNYEKAVDDFTKTIEFDIKKREERKFCFGLAYTQRAKARYLSTGDYESAIDDFEKAFEGPENHHFLNFFTRGMMFKEMGELEKACYDLKKTLEYKPNFMEARDEVQELEKMIGKELNERKMYLNSDGDDEEEEILDDGSD